MTYLAEGQRFDELVTLTHAAKSTDTVSCQCDCGVIVEKVAFRLVAGTAKRCRGRSHGLSNTYPKEYNTWLSMIYRCHNPNHESYSNYGGRGILVCKEWRESFLNFFTDMGPRPDGTELDRIDNSEGYGPRNCRWVSRSRNNRNKRTNRMLSLLGETKCIQDWVDDPRTPVSNKKTLDKRLRLGWSHYDAVMTEVRS